MLYLKQILAISTLFLMFPTPTHVDVVPKHIPVAVEQTAPEVVDLGEFKITGYCPCVKCCGKSDGITSTGVVAQANRTIAVDPKVIPYGTVLLIDGKEYVAEDCGGAINGKRIDMFYDTHQEALEWGVKYEGVSVIVE